MGRARTLVGFAAFGLFWGTWGAALPGIQERARADDGFLGIALLFIGVGALASMRAAGSLLDRAGTRGLPVGLLVFGATALLPALCCWRRLPGILPGKQRKLTLFTALSPDVHHSESHAPSVRRNTLAMHTAKGFIIKFALLLVLLVALAGCGGDGRGGDDEAGGDTTAATTSASGGDLSGRIQADGSSTVGPYTTAAAEAFLGVEPGVQVTVGVSGTGGGFERFCRGETDLSNASRPIKDEEIAACEKESIDYVEFQVANDALTIVVNSENDWAQCLTVEQLKLIWEPGSKVSNWNQVDPSFPDQELKLFGPGTDSGTFDYFTDEINGEEGASRSDYAASEDDNVIVQGVTGEKGGLGYFGFSYFEENQDALKALEVDGGEGCVAPSVETAQDASYKPLSRPLFIYAKKESFNRPEVAAFVKYLIDNETEIAESSQYVPLTDEQLTMANSDYEAAVQEATG